MKKKNLTDIVNSLVDKTFQILEWKYLNATKDEEKLPEQYDWFDQDALNEIVEIVKPLLKSAQETRRIEADTAGNIVKMVGKGKASVDDALKMMTLTKLKNEVEDQEAKKELRNKMMNLFEDEETILTTNNPESNK